jgi:hypothetical protein
MEKPGKKTCSRMDPAHFLQEALEYARQQKLDFTGYDTQYQSLRCNFLPLLKDDVVIGVVSLNNDGCYQYRELVRDPSMPGAPRGC